MKALAAYIEQELRALAQFTQTEKGVTRLPFTSAAGQAARYLLERMRAEGMEARMDASGAVIGRLGGEGPAVAVGSHYDSVAEGGAYDGIAGVVCGLALARLLRENGKTFPLEVIATNDEEGARFGTGFFSSTAMTEGLDTAYLNKFRDAEGISVAEAMRGHGLEPERIGEAKRDMSEIRQFWEIHIEQGPVLEGSGAEIGLVTGIVAMRRMKVTLYGRSDHAGTTPMGMRNDALLAAARLIEGIAGLPGRAEGYAVATVGSIRVHPDAVNIIAERAEISVDLRCETDGGLEKMVQGLFRLLGESGTRYEIEEKLDAAAGRMDEKMLDALAESCANRGVRPLRLISGAGHDALVFSRKVPTAMLFVPSRNGRSHCPAEWSSCESLALATMVLYDTLTKKEGGWTNGLSK